MNKKTMIVGIAMLIVGLGLGKLFFASSSSVPTITGSSDREPLFYRHPMDPTITSQTPAKDDMGMDYVAVYADDNAAPVEKKILFYRSSMNPAVTSPTPAKDEMGMDYLPVYQDNDQSKIAGTVTIDPVVVQNIGVRTAKAELRAMNRTIRALGRIDFDEERMVRLHPKIEGWIDSIRVDKTGEKVNKGDVLLSIYSPKLVSTQQEYLLALDNLSALKDSSVEEIRDGAKSLVASSRERLKMLDVAEHQIKELEKSHKIKKNLHIHSPAAGTIIRIGARQGQYVSPMTELYMMVDLKQVWVYADIYDYELPWIKEGDEVEMTLASVPGKIFKGRVDYIYPYAEAKTRTTKVRMEFDNNDLALRPEMLAEVSIKANTQQAAVVIPSEAVVRSGDRTQVFIVREPGKFEPRIVELGIESGGMVAINKGLKDGDEVVTSSQFLVDSESKLREATAKMMETLKNKAADTPNPNPAASTEMDMSEPADNTSETMINQDQGDSQHD